MSARQSPGWRVDFSLLAVTFIWGSTFILVKEALAGVSIMLFLTLRFTIAAVALAFLFRKDFRGPNVARSVRIGALAGVFLFGGYVLQTFGLKYTTASKAGFITGLSIALVPLFGAIIYKRPPRIVELLGVAMAFAGMALMTIQRDILEMNRGDLLVLACTVAYAFHILTLGRYSPETNLGVLATVQIATGAALGACTCWWVEPPRFQGTVTVWSALVVTSLFATALAFSVQAWAQQYISATRTALIFASEPVFSWATSYVVAGETLNGRGIAGAILILAGIVLVELKPMRAAT
jgi:drug/metabolite transporter (DMT)-like permease